MTELLAAPDESIEMHVERLLGQWNALRARMVPALERVFDDVPDNLVSYVLRCHDIGKLTDLWQRRLGSDRRPPPHAALGAAFLWNTVEWNDAARNAAAFAIAIHHVDRGLVGSNIDDPATQSVMSGIANDDGSIRWHEEAEAVLAELLLPEDGLERVTLDSMSEMAGTLRQWSRGGSYISMHANRMRASALHHCLKICDIRAAAERGGDIDPSEHAWMQQILTGGLNV